MAIDPLVFKIDGDAVGAVKAIEEVTKKLDTLKSQEKALQSAIAGVNTQTEEGKRVFAALQSELGAVDAKLKSFSATADKTAQAGKNLHDNMSKARAVMGAIGPVVGSSSQALAMVTNAAGGLAQAFAAGGALAAGITAVTIALGKLNDGLSTYIDRAAAAETARIASEAAAISAGSAVGRGATADLAALNPLTVEQQQRKKLAETEAAIAAQRAKMASRPGSALAIGALQPGEQLTRKQDEQGLEELLRLQASLNSHLAEAARLSAEAAASKEKQAADTEKAARAEAAALRLSKARAGLAAANTASAIEAENRALDLNNPDPGAGLFGSQTPVATTEQIEAMNELFMMAPSAGPGAGVIDGAVDAIEELTRASREAADALQASLVAGLQASAMSLLTSAASGNLRGVGAAAGAGLGAVAGANIAQGVAGVDPAMAQQVGGALGGLLGGALGDVATSLMDAIAQVGEKMGALAPIVDASGLVVAQLEPLWGTVADLGLVLADALLYLSPIVRLVAEAMNFVIAPLGGMAEMLHDVMQDGLVPFAIGMSTAINGIIDAINTVIRWANTTFGTDLGELGHVIVADLIAPVEDAGEAIRENLTDEFVNLPPGFKTGGAVFAATDVGGAGGGSGGLTIGTVNVSTTRTLLDELKSLQDRAGVGSSSIIGGRNSISDRRN